MTTWRARGARRRRSPRSSASRTSGFARPEWSQCAPRSTPCPRIGTVTARPPTRSRASRSATDSPAARQRRAAAMPAVPAPTIATSGSRGGSASFGPAGVVTGARAAEGRTGPALRLPGPALHCQAMLISAAFAAWRQVFSPPFRKILWRSLALTFALLVLVWLGLTRLFSSYLAGHPLSAAYPILDGLAFFLAGAGLFVALAYLLPAVSAIVAGYFLDDVGRDRRAHRLPADPPGRPLPLGQALLYGLRFAGLSLLVNLSRCCCSSCRS